MAFPKQREIELSLLTVLQTLGGSAKPRDIYRLLAAQFPQLSEQDLNEKLESSPSTRKWWNLVQWARQSLVKLGQLDGNTRGIWKVTEAGQAG